MSHLRVPSPVRWTAALGALAMVLWLLSHYSATYAAPFAVWVRSLGVWGPVAFVVAYALSELVLIPASVFTLTAGALWGFTIGSTYAFVGAMLGAVVAFSAGRYVVRPTVRHRLVNDPRFRRIDAVAERGGTTLVALLRLSPVLPFAVLNYALGITAVRMRHYVIGTIAIVPATLVYAYYGTVVATLTGITKPVHHGAASYILGAIGIIATVAAGVFISRIARSHLEKLEDDLTHEA